MRLRAIFTFSIYPLESEKTVLSFIDRYSHRRSLDSGRDRLRILARASDTVQLHSGADITAARLGQSRQPGSPERGRKLWAIRSGCADRPCNGSVQCSYRELRGDLLLCTRRSSDNPHQRLWPVYGANRGIYRGLGCVHYVCGGIASARDMILAERFKSQRLTASPGPSDRETCRTRRCTIRRRPSRPCGCTPSAPRRGSPDRS
jgi:hypothetical protein